MKGFGTKLDDICGSTEEGGQLKVWAWGQIAWFHIHTTQFTNCLTWGKSLKLSLPQLLAIYKAEMIVLFLKDVDLK